METAVRQEDTPPKASRVPRRGLLAAAAWAAPTLAVATAAPAIAASSPIDPQSDLSVAALGGAEGRYATGGSYTPEPVGPNTDFRRAFSVTNSGEGSFTGSLRIDFTFPRMWNQATGTNTDAFNNWSTQDLGGTGGTGGGSIGGVSPWELGPAATEYTQNTGDYAWEAVWLRNDPAYFTLTNVLLPPGATIWFALNAGIPFSWIGDPGVYINPGNPNRIYWRSNVDITATTTGGDDLGTYRTPVGSWTNGIWYFNGGGPYAYLGGHGLYPTYGTA